MAQTFTITLEDSGEIKQVTLLNGPEVKPIDAPKTFPGKVLAANGIGIVMTEENPHCCYWIQGGRAFKVCW
jgi:hypothetical protein